MADGVCIEAALLDCVVDVVTELVRFCDHELVPDSVSVAEGVVDSVRVSEAVSVSLLDRVVEVVLVAVIACEADEVAVDTVLI